MRDEKFCDGAKHAFDGAGFYECEYVVATRGGKRPAYIKTFDPRVVSTTAYLNRRFVEKINGFDIVIFHGLGVFAKELISRMSHKPAIAWIGMGFDYAELIYPEIEVVLPKTRQLWERSRKLKQQVWASARGLAESFVKQNPSWAYLMERIEIFSPVLPEEFDKISSLGFDVQPKYAEWNYPETANSIFSQTPKITKSPKETKYILVGNSATPTNNHVEAFHAVKGAGLEKECDILVPLNYGNPDYRAEVINVAKKLFGKRARIVDKFLPLEVYISILGNSEAVIQNQIRQQAGSSIWAAMLLERKIFLHPDGAFYENLTNNGAKVKKTTEISREEIERPLTTEEKRQNKAMMARLFDKDRQSAQTKKLVHMLLERSRR